MMMMWSSVVKLFLAEWRSRGCHFSTVLPEELFASFVSLVPYLGDQRTLAWGEA
jgi:hypothetical protein